MRESIKFGRAISTGLVSSFSSFLIFLMISVLLADAIVNILPTERIGILIGIIFTGFILSLIITMLTAFLYTRETMPKNYIIASLSISFAWNILLWIMISYMGMLIVYPSTILNISVWEVFFLFPEVIITFALYIITPDVTWLWFYSVLTYSVIFSIMLYWLKTPYENISYKNKIRNKKGLYTFRY